MEDLHGTTLEQRGAGHVNLHAVELAAPNLKLTPEVFNYVQYVCMCVSNLCLCVCTCMVCMYSIPCCVIMICLQS